MKKHPSYQYRTIKGIKKRIHRWVMEGKLGRKLNPNEHVYHIDGDPTNNDESNLIVIIKNMS